MGLDEREVDRVLEQKDGQIAGWMGYPAVCVEGEEVS